MATEYKKILIRKGTQSEFNSLQGTTAPLLEAELGFITDTNELVIGTSGGNSLSINKRFGTIAGLPAEGNHTHAFADLTSKPTTIAGFGITDAYTGSVIDAKIAVNAGDISANATDITNHIGTTTGNPHSVTATDLGLGNVTNESKATMFASPTFTGDAEFSGTVSVQTPSANGHAATKSYIDTAINDLIDSAPTDLDTLGEIAAQVQQNETDITTKQDTLVSGTNIKTVGGVSVLGAGDIPINPEWTFWWEVNEDNVSSVTLNSTNYPGLVYDTSNYDYKFVINGYTSDTDSSGSMKIEINGDSTAGRYSMLRNRTGFTSSGPFSFVEGNTTTATNMDVGVVLGSGTQGTQTVLHSEFTLSRGLDFANPSTSMNSSADYHAFIVQGRASIVSVPGNGQGQTAENTIASYSQQSDFSGGYLKPVSQGGGGNITVVKLSDLPDAGNTDKVKVRIYRRER